MESIVCSSLSQAWKEQPTSIALLSFFPSGNRFLRRGPFLLSNIFAMQSPVYWEGKFINSSQELSAGHSNTHKQKLSPFLLCSHPFPWYGMIPCPWYDTNSMVWYDSISMVWYQFHGMVWFHLHGMIAFPWYGMIPFPWYGMIPFPYNYIHRCKYMEC